MPRSKTGGRQEPTAVVLHLLWWSGALESHVIPAQIAEHNGHGMSKGIC